MAAPLRRTAAGPRPSPAPDGEGDGEAVERLVRAHQGELRGFLRYLGCPASEVDDLLQEVFLTFLSAGFEERDARSTARFLRSIARHLFLKSLRRRESRPRLEDLEAAESVWVRFHEDGGGAPYLDALRRCLDVLQGRAREALELRYTGGLGRGAIAARLDLTESGVHSILVRARKRLRECVARRTEA